MIHLGSRMSDVGELSRDVIEHDVDQCRVEVHHGPGRAAHDRTIGIRATIGHCTVCVETFAVKVRGEDCVF